MIRIYTISRVLSMGDTMGCGVVSIRVNRHFSRHGKLGPQEGKGLGLVYTSQKAPADNGTLRRGTTSDERKGRPCWRFHCPAWWSNSQENMQINYLQRLTRKLRLAAATKLAFITSASTRDRKGFSHGNCGAKQKPQSPGLCSSLGEKSSAAA